MPCLWFCSYCSLSKQTIDDLNKKRYMLSSNRIWLPNNHYVKISKCCPFSRNRVSVMETDLKQRQYGIFWLSYYSTCKSHFSAFVLTPTYWKVQFSQASNLWTINWTRVKSSWTFCILARHRGPIFRTNKCCKISQKNCKGDLLVFSQNKRG